MESKKASVQREIAITGKQKGKCTKGDSYQWKAKRQVYKRRLLSVESKKASVQREIAISGKQKGKCTEGGSYQWKAKRQVYKGR